MAYAAHQETELRGTGLSDRAILGAVTAGFDFTTIVQLVKLVWQIAQTDHGKALWDMFVKFLEGLAPKGE